MIDFIAGRLVAEHDDRCAIHKGHPCNCALAALKPERHAWDDLFAELGANVRRT
jgi:hypothetical protein